MIKKHTVFESFLKYIIALIFLFVIYVYVYKHKSLYTILTGLVIFTIFLYVRLKCYKVLIFDDKIIFYELLKKNRIFNSEDIIKIHISSEDIHTRIEGPRRYMYIQTDKEKYAFNIHELENERFYDDIREFISKNNIRYIHDK